MMWQKKRWLVNGNFQGCIKLNSIPINKRYLVYLASNHQGLDVERHVVLQYMASLGMVNVGLACRDDASPYNWDLTRELIESCDLFIVLLGDNYDPRLPTGISYLHREYVHAKSINKPTLAFIKNCLPGQNLTEEQSRLSSLHKLVMQQSPYKLWHLRDELVSQVRITLSSSLLTIGTGWVPANKSIAQPSAEKQHQTMQPLTSRQKLARSQQMLNLMVSAKVYQAGNLTVVEVFLPTRLDRLLNIVLPRMKEGASEDSLRGALSQAVSKTVTEQLLDKNPKAHAVDDIRINREQFQQILKSWQEYGLVTVKKDNNRTIYFNSSPGN